ncbi:MAG: ABC transporter ATP-binding protein [Bacteroidales bacterium]|nr:ABC transporter ATP-binding protein [Bacteroidales bacterium]MCF8405455.1 ABC transporter ATP-binding protein [Bacteroidales bacterium]
MIRTKNIERAFGNLKVLKGIDLEIKKGEVVSIVGASGAGKSTLLHILGTIDKADKGSLFIDEMEVNLLSDNKLSEFRNQNIGFVFQFHHLLPEFTALENVCIPGLIARKSKNEVSKEAKKILEILNLSDRLDHKPNELSGGEQQRVAVARALINKPLVVFADEPSGNLDSASAVELHKLFFSLRENLGQTCVIVTHNLKLADMADRKLVIEDGRIINPPETQ